MSLVKEWTLAVYSAPSRLRERVFLAKMTGMLPKCCAAIQQRHIHLVVEKAVHLEYAAFFHLPVPQDPLF